MWILCGILFECVAGNAQEKQGKTADAQRRDAPARAWYPAVVMKDYWRFGT